MSRVRNVGIVAHIDAGKTTFTERVLFYAGISHKIGEVHTGDTQLDYLPEERARGITITAAVTSFDWNKKEIHLIDTPGHVDFSVEVERSLRVLDGAVVVFCGRGGVEPQSETVWRQADRYGIPRLAFINKLDRVGADFDRVLNEMRTRLGVTPLPLTLPIGIEADFEGVVDLLSMEAVRFDPEDQGVTVHRSEIPESLRDASKDARERLIEILADGDDELAELYLKGEEPSQERICEAIRAQTLSCRIFPTYAGSALRNRGIQPVLDGIAQFMPSPNDLPAAKGKDPSTGETITRESDSADSFSALVFKVTWEEGRRTVYLRVYSGSADEGEHILVVGRNIKERLPRIFLLHANKRKRLKTIRAGDIGAARGLKAARTGDTITAPEAPILYESIPFEESVVSVAVEPRTTVELKKLEDSLEKMADEDPSLRLDRNEETGQLVLSGMGELHLEVAIHHLARDFGVEVRTGEPQVIYRETSRRSGRAIAVFDRQVGEKRLACEAVVQVRAASRNSGLSIRLGLDTESLPVEVVEALHQGAHEACLAGWHGYEIQDIAIDVEKAGFLGTDPNPMSAKVAVMQATKEAYEEASPILLEPIMSVKIETPEEFLPGVIADLNSRGGRIEQVERESLVSTVSALVPLSRLFGYATDLRSASQGRAVFSMTFELYDQARTASNDAT